MIFLRNREGNYLNLWANGGNPNVKGRTHQTLNYPFCLFPQSLNSARMWLRQLLHGDGKSMGSNFEFGENPFLGKINFDFWSNKAPKNAYPFAHTPTFFIFGHAGKAWELFFTSMIWVVVCFLHGFGPWTFSPIIKDLSWALSLNRMEVSYV